jgi:D-alanine transaminase
VDEQRKSAGEPLNRSPARREALANVNGELLPLAEVKVSALDRGFLFGDAVYEVLRVYAGKPWLEGEHFERLGHSLEAIRITGIDLQQLARRMHQTIAAGPFSEAIVYIQITRGAAPRAHPFPAHATPLQLLWVKEFHDPYVEARQSGAKALLQPDIRWGRCDIKSTGLLPAVLAKTKAKQAGCYEAWLIDDEGFITEGASTNVWIVTPENVLVTRALGNDLLPGVTRAGVLRALAEEGVNAIEERPFTLNEAHAAREAFCTSSGGGIVPVISIDGKTVGEGRPGPMVKKVQSLYRQLQEREAVA